VLMNGCFATSFAIGCAIAIDVKTSIPNATATFLRQRNFVMPVTSFRPALYMDHCLGSHFFVVAATAVVERVKVTVARQSIRFNEMLCATADSTWSKVTAIMPAIHRKPSSSGQEPKTAHNFISVNKKMGWLEKEKNLCGRKSFSCKCVQTNDETSCQWQASLIKNDWTCSKQSFLLPITAQHL